MFYTFDKVNHVLSHLVINQITRQFTCVGLWALKIELKLETPKIAKRAVGVCGVIIKKIDSMIFCVAHIWECFTNFGSN